MHDTLRQLLSRLDLSGCWWGLFTVRARCRQPATYHRPLPVRVATRTYESSLLVGARWCAQHRHADDQPMA